MWIGTFHSICVRILRRYADRLGYTSGFSIYDRTDSKTLLKEVYKRLDISDKTIEYNLVLNKISDAKNNLVFRKIILNTTAMILPLLKLVKFMVFMRI